MSQRLAQTQITFSKEQSFSIIVFWISLAGTILSLTILPIGSIVLPSVFGWLWEGYLVFASEISATFAGTLGVYLSRIVSVSLRPSPADLAAVAPYRDRWGTVLGTMLYSAASLSTIALLLLVLDLFGGFALANWITAKTYSLSMDATMIAIVVGYYQNYPGVLLNAGKNVFAILGKGRQRVEYTPKALETPFDKPKWVRFGYWLQVMLFSVAPLAMIVGGVFIIKGFSQLLYSGYGAHAAHPTIAELAFLAFGQYWVGVAFGWISFYSSTFMIWVRTNGFPTSIAAWYELNRAAALTMLAILPGPLSQWAGTGMVAWRSGAMGINQAKGLYTAYSQIAGNLILLGSTAITVLFVRRKNGNGTSTPEA